ncbi:fumarate hydratase C-terminal domain-containing protein [Roseibium algae]|uniref:Fumarate hydratase C-terminal domain-containing protein n=1 Tax=Roseibium algae TaxID=3123038 RepID=A0ABU8TMW5_9HYPH
MAEHELKLPLGRSDVEQLHVGDTVYLSGEIFTTAGLPTYGRLLDCLEGKEALPFDFTEGALFHLGSLNKQRADGSWEILYMNPTTSTRFNPHMPRLIEGLGLRLTGGKGGLDATSAAQMKACGCAYLAFLGGGAPIITAGIKRVVEIGWPEMIEHYRVVRIEVERLGPLVVGIDAHGRSVYDETRATANERREQILADMRVSRG